MKKIILSIAAASAVAVAIPAAASAQGYYRDDYRSDRVERLDRRIDMGVRNGSLNRREAWRLKGELRDVARLEADYRRGGLNRWERDDLDRRFDRLSAQIRYERHDRDYGYDYGRRY
ncbi:MAG: hypothetical protein J7521_08210 [Caulobacter sp.]|nr:hypothetical protein [Caulobacter sp.]